MASARIALADDQALVREGLKLVLRSLDIEIAVEAADGRELVDKLASATVDVIVSDVRMPALSGIEALRALRARGDRTPMILLTTFDDSAVLLEAVERARRDSCSRMPRPKICGRESCRSAAGSRCCSRLPPILCASAMPTGKRPRRRSSSPNAR